MARRPRSDSRNRTRPRSVPPVSLSVTTTGLEGVRPPPRASDASEGVVKIPTGTHASCEFRHALDVTMSAPFTLRPSRHRRRSELGPHEHCHIDVSYLNLGEIFYYPCSVLDGCSRAIVHRDLRASNEVAGGGVHPGASQGAVSGSTTPGSSPTTARSSWRRTSRSHPAVGHVARAHLAVLSRSQTGRSSAGTRCCSATPCARPRRRRWQRRRTSWPALSITTTGGGCIARSATSPHWPSWPARSKRSGRSGPQAGGRARAPAATPTDGTRCLTRVPIVSAARDPAFQLAGSSASMEKASTFRSDHRLSSSRSTRTVSCLEAGRQ